MKPGNVRSNLQGSGNQIDCDMRLPTLAVNNPQQMQRIGMRWMIHQNLAINDVCLIEPARDVVPHGRFNGGCGRFIRKFALRFQSNLRI